MRCDVSRSRSRNEVCVPNMSVRPTVPAFAPALVPALVLAQIVSLQAGSAVAKGAYGEIDPTALAGLRLGFAALVMWALVRPRPRRLSARQWWAAGALGAVLAAMNVAYFRAIEYLPLGVASTVELLGPLLLAVALSRRPAHLVAALLALAGVLLLAAPGASMPLVGLALGVGAALCRASYIVLNRRVGRLFPDWSGLAVALATGACLLAPVAALSGGGTVADRPALLWTGLAVAVLSSLIPYSLDMAVLRRIDARSFGVLLALSPAVGAGIGFAFLQEQLTWRQGLAIALVVTAGAWSSSITGRPPRGPGGSPTLREE